MVILSGKNASIGDKFSEIKQKYSFVAFSFVKILLEICEECATMASIPQGAFAAFKLRSQKEASMIVSKMMPMEKSEPKNFSSKKLMEYTPVKYNSKLMKSIWGLYNRYSPHNMKGNDDESSYEEVPLQQPITVAACVIAENIAMTLNSGNEWTFPGKPMC